MVWEQQVQTTETLIKNAKSKKSLIKPDTVHNAVKQASALSRQRADRTVVPPDAFVLK